MSSEKASISIRNLIPQPSFLQKCAIFLLDRLMGIHSMNRLYQANDMQGLSKEAFCDKLIAMLKLDIQGIEALQAKIPKTGPVVVASNHPFGGIEGVILARVIGQVRPDLKVLANQALGIFPELRDYFIFTDPLSPKDVKNGPSLRQCLKHVQDQGALLVFPAGKVSHFNKSTQRTFEASWNKIVARLIEVPACQYLPVFVSGSNSKRFYQVEALHVKLRMLLLGRELLNKTGQSIALKSGHSIQDRHFSRTLSRQQKADVCRMLSYTQDPNWQYHWPADTSQQQQALIAPISQHDLLAEIAQLPSEQLLVEHKSYKVYYAYQSQAPLIVRDIARLRELVFREHNEGSGEALDTDKFDATYTHLFIVDTHEPKIVGAYRMGLSDVLIKNDGIEGLYLHKMFAFSPAFINQREPCMEMGRSFLIPELQGSYQGLLLLWKGIGHFAVKFPQYRTLYGTVSISKLYDPRSVKLIEQALVTPTTQATSPNVSGLASADSVPDVQPRQPFDFGCHPEVLTLAQDLSLKDQLTALLASIEADGKDIPVLAKQYAKMGAQFHALGIDTSFNHTPGLLLSVNLPASPEKFLKLYCGEQWQAYRDWQAYPLVHQ